MSDTINTGPDRIDTEADLGTGDAALWAFWMGEDKIAAKEEEKWQKKARAIIKRYRAEYNGQNSKSTGDHRFNVLWSNVQTLKPILYARTPKPDVQRRFLDPDETGRLASLLLERAISYSLEQCAFDTVMEACVEDRLLPGRGVPRVLYTPIYGDPLPPEEAEESADVEDFEEAESASAVVSTPGDDPDPLREVVSEKSSIVYVYWEDYREAPARTWREVPWIRYRAYMSKDELVERFGAKGKKVNLDFLPRGADQTRDDRSEPPPDIFKKAIVYEFWDRTKGRVIWLAPGTPDLILDNIEDPLGLPDFFPSPDPLVATTTTGKRIPVPDYVEYEDQAHELDVMTARIDVLTKALKVSGVYPGSLKHNLQQLVDGGVENKLIPVEDWQAWMDKGGLKEFIQFMPLTEVASTLIQLYEARDKTLELLYQVTGLSDIMRGNTQPMETATAQRMKSNFSTRRVQPQQRAVARLATDSIRLIAAVIATHFSPRTISEMTGYPQLLPVPALPPPPPQFIPAPMQQAPEQPMQPGMMA